jgi:leucyl/phenylalanyl-tRNA--protein transferase
MAVYQLDKHLWFPPRHEYEDHGVIALGGDVSAARLIMAYRSGIFPWNNPGEEFTWWCPVKRMVLRPSEVRITKSSRNLLNRGKFRVTADTCFEEVINQCQNAKRPGQDGGTWLTDELKENIIEIHKLGFAHSVEVFEEDKLVGGLYGLSFGKIFSGDSMFSLVSNASKIAFIHLCKMLEQQKFDLLDCQIYNEHLASLGAYEIPRDAFLNLVEANKKLPSLEGPWTEYLNG